MTLFGCGSLKTGVYLEMGWSSEKLRFDSIHGRRCDLRRDSLRLSWIQHPLSPFLFSPLLYDALSHDPMELAHSFLASHLIGTQSPAILIPVLRSLRCHPYDLVPYPLPSVPMSRFTLPVTDSTASHSAKHSSTSAPSRKIPSSCESSSVHFFFNFLALLG